MFYVCRWEHGKFGIYTKGEVSKQRSRKSQSQLILIKSGREIWELKQEFTDNVV